MRQNRFLFGFIGPDNKPASDPDHRQVAFHDLARDPNTPIQPRRPLPVAARGRDRDLRRRYLVPEAGEWGAEFVNCGPRRSPRADPRPLRGPARRPHARHRRPGAVGKDPDPRRRRRRHRQDLQRHRARPRPSTRSRSTRRSPSTPRSSSSSQRPRSATSTDCGPMLDVIKAVADAEPASPSSTSSRTSSSTPTAGSSRSSTRPASSSSSTHRASGACREPWIFVVDGDGMRPGLVRGDRSAQSELAGRACDRGAR